MISYELFKIFFVFVPSELNVLIQKIGEVVALNQDESSFLLANQQRVKEILSEILRNHLALPETFETWASFEASSPLENI